MTISALIDKQDNFEIVRDQIAAILVAESASQQNLATIAGRVDLTPWQYDVYTERSNPWAKWLNTSDLPTDVTPIVNVWVDASQFPRDRGSPVGRSQGHDVTYNIDVYAYGLSEDNPAGGHLPGDAAAGEQIGHIVKLLRNILISGDYTYLDLRGVVSERWIQSLTFFQPSQDAQGVQNIRGARMTLVVKMVESSPQVTGDTLESIFTEVRRDGDGKVLFDVDISVT
mgnify:CR=1 FL=1